MNLFRFRSWCSTLHSVDSVISKWIQKKLSSVETTRTRNWEKWQYFRIVTILTLAIFSSFQVSVSIGLKFYIILVHTFFSFYNWSPSFVSQQTPIEAKVSQIHTTILQYFCFLWVFFVVFCFCFLLKYLVFFFSTWILFIYHNT